VASTAANPVCLRPQNPLSSAPSLAAPASSTLTGVVERIVFLNEENHYTIAEFRPDSTPAARPPAAGAGPARRGRGAQADLVTIVGRCLASVRRDPAPHRRWVGTPSTATSSRWSRSSRSCRRACMASANTSAAASCPASQGLRQQDRRRLRHRHVARAQRGIGPAARRARHRSKRATAIKRAWDEKRPSANSTFSSRPTASPPRNA